MNAQQQIIENARREIIRRATPFVDRLRAAEQAIAITEREPRELYHNERLQTFECLGCTEIIEIPRRALHDPEAFLNFHELTTLDHSECWRYATLEQAKQAREYRSEKKRRALREAKRLGSRNPHVL